VRTRFLAIGVIAGLLAACTSSKADPKPTPSSAARTTASSTAGTATPTPSRTGPLTTGPNVRPGEKPPVYPDLAKQHSANGALAFAIYFMKTFDWGYATNDPYLLEQLILPACRGCAEYVRTFSGLSDKHELIRGGRLTPVSAGVLHEQFDFKADFVLDMVYDEQPVVLAGASNASTVAASLSRHHTLVFVRWTAGQWKVADVTAK
jgi:hypothetical protein